MATGGTNLLSYNIFVQKIGKKSIFVAKNYKYAFNADLLETPLTPEIMPAWLGHTCFMTKKPIFDPHIESFSKKTYISADWPWLTKWILDDQLDKDYSLPLIYERHNWFQI